jgi:cytochrome c
MTGLCAWPLHAANPAKELFDRRCGGCHSATADKAGPRLAGIFGRTAASLGSFPYSEALRKSGVVWNEATLDRWLTDPDAFVRDSDMGFGLESAEERKAVIEYLRSLR